MDGLSKINSNTNSLRYATVPIPENPVFPGTSDCIDPILYIGRDIKTYFLDSTIIISKLAKNAFRGSAGITVFYGIHIKSK